MGDLFSPFSPARAETRQESELAGQYFWDPGIKCDLTYGTKCPLRERDRKNWWSNLGFFYYSNVKWQIRPENQRNNNKWLIKYYKLGLWFKTMAYFAILIFSSNGGAFCESNSIDVVFKYSTSVKLKKPSCEKSIYYGYVEKEGKWVENPCPILLVECAWWSKHHKAKDRELIYLRNKNVLVRSMAANRRKTTVGSVIQHVASNMVSPSMAGRSEYRHASPYGQHGPTYHCWDGPSGRNGRENV